jgi:sugar (pentulose or hexulose) kinase
VNGRLLLTLDLGTTNCKAVAFALDGTPVASASVAYPTLNPREGWYEQRPADWRAAVETSLRQVGDALGTAVDDVAGLCLSAWGPGLVLLDADYRPLNDASPTWQDVRSLEHGRRLVREAGAEWVGGGMPLTGFPAKLAWATESWPELAASASQAVGVKDYLVGWLTGSPATDPSSGPYSASWPAAVFEAIGWDVARLPPVLASTEVAGHLLAERAEQLRLPAGLPVVTGLNDGAAATLGVGAHRPGDAVVSLGTNGVFRLVTSAPISAAACLERSLFRYPIVGDIWACGGFVLSGGSALAWLADAVAAPGRPAEIEVLLGEASEAPAGSDGVVFLPYLVGKGSPAPDADAAASFLGLRSRHRRSHLTRAVLEGVAFGVRDIADAFRDLGLEPERLFVTGGGAASPLWRSIVANVLGLPAAHTVGDSNLGSAAVLAVGLGLAPDLERALASLLPEPSTTETTPEEIAAYESAYRAFGSRR